MKFGMKVIKCSSFKSAIFTNICPKCCQKMTQFQTQIRYLESCITLHFKGKGL